MQVLFSIYSVILFVSHVFKIGESVRQQHVLIAEQISRKIGQNMERLTEKQRLKSKKQH